MAKLRDKVQNALDENRMMVLGVQVLIGFDFRAVFERGYEHLPRLAQLLKLGSLSLLCVTLALLLTPGADHRIAEHGEDSPEFHRFITGFASGALLPFSLGLAIDMGLAGWKAAGPLAGMLFGVVGGVVALAMWYGIELIARRRRGGHMKSESEEEKTKLSDKIRHVLTEARVVLPGVQALLGFQFAAMLAEGFDTLPKSLKYVHLGALACMALSIILLMTPPAWHRLVERGEESESFHRFASAMIVAALVPIAVGISADFYVVTWKVTGSSKLAAVGCAALAATFVALWFGLSLARRLRVADRRAMAARPACP